MKMQIRKKNIFQAIRFERRCGRAETAVLSALLALAAGCFAHKEAPERLVTARGMEEAAALGDAVQALDLSGAKGDLPPAISGMKGLRNLYLRDGAISDFAPLAALESLEVLDLGRVRLEAVPSEVLSLKSLRDLYLCGCGLAAFPAGLEALPALRYLNLDRNSIQTLPDALPPHLAFLRLNRNSISELPPSVGALSSLRRLYLRGNRLQALPAELAQCTELTDIDLADNDLAEFPACLAALPKLRNLDLSGNRRITSLPDDETLAKMGALKTLRLTGCPLDNDERARIRKAAGGGAWDCAIIF